MLYDFNIEMSNFMKSVFASGFLAAIWLCSNAPALGQNLLFNPGFEDVDNNMAFGDGWGIFGNTEFNDFFGGNPHASLFANTAGNSGAVFQLNFGGAAGETYQFDLIDLRIEENFDADLTFGLEYYAGDDATKLGETIVTIDTATRLANGQIEGNVVSMQGTSVPGTVFVRPIVQFDNVNAAYSNEMQANAFLFDTYFSVAAGPGEEALKNPGFDDDNADGNFGDYWSGFGNVAFGEIFGPGNAHASLFADNVANSGGIFQPSVLGAPDTQYIFELTNVRVEDNFDGQLFFGLEYYAADNFTKIGESIEQANTTSPGDGLSYRLVATSVPGTVYVRPIVFFENVLSTGGTLRNVFIFETSLTEVGPGVNLLSNPGFLDLNMDTLFGDGWTTFFITGFNDFFGNPHASFFANFGGSFGIVFQDGIAGSAGETYQFDLLNVRIEENWDADLFVGLEYYAGDDFTKLGESLVQVDTDTRLANGQIDGNTISMQATTIPGTVFVRPIFSYDNVNPTYNNQPQANLFVFDTYFSVAPTAGDPFIKNGGFEDSDGNGSFGDTWSSFGAASFNEFFGAGNPHASLFPDNVANVGGVFQTSILGTPGANYKFDLLDVRIEANIDADLFFGLEYYAEDNFTKLGETIAQIDTSTTGDGLSFSITGTAVPGAVYVRPIVSYDNVGFTGGSQRNVFIFATAMTEVAATPVGDMNCDGVTNLSDIAPFALALTDAATYAATFPSCDVNNGDINMDTAVDGRDVASFVALLLTP